MKIKLKVLMLLFLFTTTVCQGQEFFNTDKQFGVELQGMKEAGWISNMFSATLNYKMGRHVILLGYKTENMNGDLDQTFKGIKAGYQIYPHRNQKAFKVYYQGYFQVDKNDYWRVQKRALLFFGPGVDYWLNKYLAIGLNIAPAFGFESSKFNTENYEIGKWVHTVDLAASFNLKYYL